jgi:hypothetical protein
MRSFKTIVSERQQLIIKVLLVCITTFMAVRLAWLVDRYAVDLPYWDQWDIWTGLFQKADLWTLWRWQHGPQRQGLGQWIIALCAWASDWNVRAEEFVSAFIIFLAAVVGLAIPRSLRGRWSVSDCLIPIALLTVSMVPVVTEAPNLSHGPLPLLLALICAYFTQVEDERTRVTGTAVTAAICAQSGFAWFMAVIAVPLLLVLLYGAVRSGRRVVHHVIGVAVVLASLAVFFYGFKFIPAVACFRFPDPQPWRYVKFVGVMVSQTAELTQIWAHSFGIIGSLLGLCLALWSGFKTVATAGKDRLASTVFVLSAFSLTFAVNTAIGRVCLGLGAALAERYVPYMLTLVIAAYLFVSMWPRFRYLRMAVIIGLFAIAITKETMLTKRPIEESNHYARIKAGFRDCYLGGATLQACSAQWPIHPNPQDTRLQEKLDYLRDHRLSLFRKVPR